MIFNVHNLSIKISREFKFDLQKNAWLKEKRDICFEEIIEAIEQGFLLDVGPHPNQERYPNQELYIVKLKNYIYMVPFIDNGQTIFLKTIILSRKAYKRYFKQHRVTL